MGGNTKAIDRSTGQVVKFAGRDAFADKVDMRVIDRTTFRHDIIEMLKQLDQLHKKSFNVPIWNPKSRDRLLTTGEAFNGSSEHLFGSKVSDEEFAKYKPKVGDIDLTVPEQHIKTIFDLLGRLEGKKITNKVTYVGQNKSKQHGAQINALFAYYYDPDNPLFVQVDFEAVKYDDADNPDEFGKFGHSSSWDDVQAGVKGAFHKLLLRSITKIVSHRDDIVILTPSSPLFPPEKVKVSKTKEAKRLFSFSVDGGLRMIAAQQFLPNGEPLTVQGKLAYKLVDPKNSDYARSREEIFRLLFNDDPTPNELNELGSFLGLMQLLKRRVDPNNIDEIYVDFVSKLYGPDVRPLDATDKEADVDAKLAALKVFEGYFPSVKKHATMVNGLAQEYYKNYKIRAAIEEYVRRYLHQLLQG